MLTTLLLPPSDFQTLLRPCTNRFKHAPHNLHMYLPDRIRMHIPSPANSYNFLQLFIAHSRFWLTISIRFFLLKRSNAFSNRLVVCWYFLSHLRFSRELTFSKYNPVLNTIQTRNLHENVGEIFWEENLTLFVLNKYKYLIQMSQSGKILSK